MDLYICGIIDIILVVLAVLVIIIGYKKGFLHKAIGLIGLFVGLVIAFVFCQQLASCFKSNGIIYNNIYDSIYQRALESQELQSLTVRDVLINMGINDFFADMFARSIGDINPLEVATKIADYFAYILLIIICFFILFFGVFLASIVLKILSKILRGSKIIRFIDGLLGIVLYFGLFAISVYIVFTIIKYMENADFFVPVKNFLDVDMKLNDPDTFRLSKFFYEHNIIYSILHIFF